MWVAIIRDMRLPEATKVIDSVLLGPGHDGPIVAAQAGVAPTRNTAQDLVDRLECYVAGASEALT